MRMKNFRRSTTAAAKTPRALEMYDVAYLAGGAPRVAECAVIALSERGLLVLRVSRVRAAHKDLPRHPVERAAIASCPRSSSTASVCADLQLSPEVEAIGDRLAEWGLVTGRRPRLTREGRQQLQAAERDGTLPPYVFGGPAVLPEGAARRGVMDAQTVPPGLGRALLRMGRALDDSGSDHYDSGSSCGGGGGGGGSD